MNKQVEIDYTNWRGERRRRIIEPFDIKWASNRWHKEEQWLLFAICAEDNCIKTFAMSGIHRWRTL